MSETRHPTVLIVDDDPDTVRATVGYFTARGLRIFGADTPLGVSLLDRLHRPAVVILDVLMPALDGRAMAWLLRRRPGVPPVDIVFYSAIDEPELRRLTMQHEGSRYVKKGDGLARLFHEVVSLLRGAAPAH